MITGFSDLHLWIRKRSSFREFKREFRQFRGLAEQAETRFRIQWEDRYPCLDDKTSRTEFDRHYVYHTAWAARVLAETKPEYHVDISSLLYFATIVSAFVPVRFYDYRPVEVELSGLTSDRADLHALPFSDDSIISLSCMHVVEHVGLGRYGDTLDPEGDLKAIAELKRVLAPRGTLLFVVPIGKPVIRFNAHRIYSYEQVKSYFSGLTLREFALIPDRSEARGMVVENAQALADSQRYGCGCFWFTKE